ncbi:macro domain-containing protein [Tomitella fengzijianii]|uniref:O-acetyl-ADP-ribose deacetylase n=1 Tax=Tomitella fengzijianii TaxID=2597660 RepID=A0A516X3X6_9ACTN|nr:macro domain-containing protein [Tomitella fengzijianii]QDQ97776.1 O-acetyl-ADP-ribose deacetylase [Tomitella fengzijianii]
MPLIDVAVADVARLTVDAVVVATGPDLRVGAGPSGSVQRRAGPGVQNACRLLRETTFPRGLDVGYAVATPGGDLPAQWVILTVGPRYSRREDRSGVLRDTYRRCLLVAESVGARTLACPLLSSGGGAWPEGDAVDQAVRAIGEARCGVEVVTLVTADPRTARLMMTALE